MPAKTRLSDSHVKRWRKQTEAAATQKDKLLRCYYAISKEAEGLYRSGVSGGELLTAVAKLFVGPSEDSAAGATRATRLMRLHHMSESLIDLAAKQLRAGERGVSISHVLLLTRVDNRKAQLELLRGSIAEGAGYRRFAERVKSVASPSRHRPTIIIKQLDRSVSELEQLLSEVAKPGFVAAVESTTDRLRKVTIARLERTQKRLGKVEQKLERCKRNIEEAADLLR